MAIIEERTFSVAASPEEALLAAQRHLESLGHRRLRGVEEVVLVRGSWLGNLISCNPARWRSRVRLSVVEGSRKTRLRARFEVSTAWQRVVETERDYWRSEVDSLEAALRGQSRPPMDCREVARKGWARALGNPSGPSISYWDALGRGLVQGAAFAALMWLTDRKRHEPFWEWAAISIVWWTSLSLAGRAFGHTLFARVVVCLGMLLVLALLIYVALRDLGLLAGA